MDPNDASQGRRRRRGGSTDVQQRCCTHCGRTFKRSEHLERHVRTHTKEKPYICHCGSAFSRRDLLTRHSRISHEGGATSPDNAPSDDIQQAGSVKSDPSSAGTDMSPIDMNGSATHWMRSPTYIDQGQDLAGSYGTVPPSYSQGYPSQGFFDHGHDMAGFDQFRDMAGYADQGAAMDGQWPPYYYDQSAEPDHLDPSLQGFGPDPTVAPMVHGNHHLGTAFYS